MGIKTKQAILQKLEKTPKQARKFIVEMLARQAHFMNAEKSGEVSLAFVLRIRLAAVRAFEDLLPGADVY